MQVIGAIVVIIAAAKAAISSPLLESTIDGARGILLNITGPSDLGLFEMNAAAEIIQGVAHPDANIIFGTVIDDEMGDEVKVTVIAAGFDRWDGAPAGASTLRVIVGEVLPNLLPQLVVVATVEAASAILLEAALSFLGLGVQPPLPSWGLMISEAKSYMFFSFWLIALPGAALAILIFAINLAGDGLRDLLAPEGRA